MVAFGKGGGRLRRAETYKSNNRKGSPVSAAFKGAQTQEAWEEILGDEKECVNQSVFI